MANVVIVGMQWGDEGKGKIVDLLCPAFEVVARYQGGHNAGHTVKFLDRHFALHLIPSGILHAGMLCVLGNGMVIHPETFFEELDRLHEKGVATDGNLFISNRAQVLLPIHIAVDRAREEARGEKKIGTTSRGIGPAYETKVNRLGLRMHDLWADDLEERLGNQMKRVEGELAAAGVEPEGLLRDTLSRCRKSRQRLEPYVCDTAQRLNGWIDEGKSVLFEGAQGTLLDVDHGTYPFVTSSNSTAGGASTGTGVPPTRIGGVVGVLKAYTTRVGGGPFATELEDATGEHLRRRGNEFGTTTGRPRRCGWLDLVVARYARQLNGVETIALTKLDVLDALEEIPVCVGYRAAREVYKDFPADWRVLAEAEPVYRVIKGWQQETAGLLDYTDLPQAARDYIALIEEEVGATVTLVSTGPRREETALRDDPILSRFLGGRLGTVLKQRSQTL